MQYMVHRAHLITSQSFDVLKLLEKGLSLSIVEWLSDNGK